MLCPVCHGTHVIRVDGRPRPCPECQGVGEIHCCDGLQEQPQESGDRGQETGDTGRGAEHTEPSPDS